MGFKDLVFMVLVIKYPVLLALNLSLVVIITGRLCFFSFFCLTIPRNISLFESGQDFYPQILGEQKDSNRKQQIYPDPF